MSNPITYKRADHINICVPVEQLEDARLFYRDIIGLTQIERPDVFGIPGHWFIWANIELHLGIEPYSPPSVRHTAFEVTNLEEARQWLLSNNIQLYPEPLIPGRDRFSFYDPFGNRFELMVFVG